MYKSITKKELAEKMGISSCTLKIYLNKIWFNKLKEFGYNKRQKILSINQLKVITEIWGEWENNIQ